MHKVALRHQPPFNFCFLSVDIFTRRISFSACRINISQVPSRSVSELCFKFFFYLWFPNWLIKIGFVTCFPLCSQLHPVWLLGQDPNLSFTQDFLPWESVLVYYYNRLWMLRRISNGRMMSFIGCLVMQHRSSVTFLPLWHLRHIFLFLCRLCFLFYE